MGINPFVHGSAKHTDIMKTEGLKRALNKYGFDAAFGGARRDEENPRERAHLLFRDRFHRWDPKISVGAVATTTARLTKAKASASSALQLDRAGYLAVHLSGNIEIVPLYLAAERPVLERDGMLMIDDDRIDLQPGEVMKTDGAFPYPRLLAADRRGGV